MFLDNNIVLSTTLFTHHRKSGITRLSDLFSSERKRVRFFIPALLVLSFASCSGEQDAEKPGDLAPSDSIFVYPLKDYFIAQIKSVGAGDSIYYSDRENGLTKDSGLIDKVSFNKFAYGFIEKDISDNGLKHYYRQSVFWDQTTGSVTFSYAAIDRSLPVQSVDILVDTANQEIKRVFISTTLIKQGDTVYEKLGWKSGSSFFINRISNSAGNKENTSEVQVVWNKNK